MNRKKLLNIILALSLVILPMDVAFSIVNNDTSVEQAKTTKVKKDKNGKKKTKKNKVVAEEEQTEYTNDVHSSLTLQDCMTIAVKYNPQIRSALYNEEVYKSKIGQAWANYFPVFSVGIEASRTRNHYSKELFPGYNGNTTTMGYLPNVSGEMLLFDFGKTKASADMAKRTYEASKAGTQENINTIIRDIKTAYYNILFAQAQVKVYEDTVKDYELQLKQAWGFYNLGKKAKIDVVTAEYNLGKAQLNLVKAKNVLEVAQVNLAKIMGIPKYTNYELTDELSLNKYDKTIDVVMEKALTTRPELIAAKKNVDAAKMTLRAARREFTPNIGMFASYGNGLGSEYNISSAQFGAGLNYNALNIAKVKKQVDQAKAAYNKSKADYNVVKDEVYFNVEKNFMELRTNSEAIVIAKLSLDQAKEQYRQVTGRYKAGIGDAIELKDGENTYLNARLDFYNAMLNYNVTAANLEREIGLPLTFSDDLIIEIHKENL